jgi:hypothetical protein
MSKLKKKSLKDKTINHFIYFIYLKGYSIIHKCIRLFHFS